MRAVDGDLESHRSGYFALGARSGQSVFIRIRRYTVERIRQVTERRSSQGCSNVRRSGMATPLICRNFRKREYLIRTYHSSRQGRTASNIGIGRASCVWRHRRPKSRRDHLYPDRCPRHCRHESQSGVSNAHRGRAFPGPPACQFPTIDVKLMLGATMGPRRRRQKSRRWQGVSRTRARSIASRPIPRQHVANTETQTVKRSVPRNCGRFPFRSLQNADWFLTSNLIASSRRRRRDAQVSIPRRAGKSILNRVPSKSDGHFRSLP